MSSQLVSPTHTQHQYMTPFCGIPDETQYWSQAVDALTELIELRNSPGPRETLVKVNRSIADFPTELDTEAGYEQFKATEKKFIHGLEELRDGARKEVE